MAVVAFPRLVEGLMSIDVSNWKKMVSFSRAAFAKPNRSSARNICEMCWLIYRCFAQFSTACIVSLGAPVLQQVAFKIP
ncbi:hypothetical protein J2W51_000135 [Tardiphaga robiniae]|uniref:hypothetical protein n=1 Tax=Tardiphaga robiniae TaxID=943830 RepID=UPI0028641D92|nr:hypothetical protein [Tardiphaga robiniae]MDR6657593.1 hypothetical protein [Tardiphaga robiniae]